MQTKNTLTTSTWQRATTGSAPVLHFAAAQLRVALRNVKGLFVSTLTPLFMLLIFWLFGDAQSLAFIFPTVISLSVMFGGSAQAVRMISWRQQGIYRRLAVTPTPLGWLALGDAAAQVGLSVLQGVATLLFGALVLGISISGWGTAAALVVLTVTAACFIAYGALIAGFVRKPELANPIFIFTLLPLFFLGGGLPPDQLPPLLRLVGAWSPVGAANKLLIPLLADGRLPADAGLALLALSLYTTCLALLAARKFSW